MYRRGLLISLASIGLAGCLADPLPSFGESLEVDGLVATPHHYELVDAISGDSERTSHEGEPEELLVAEVSLGNESGGARRPPWPADNEVYLFNEGVENDVLPLADEFEAGGESYNSFAGAIETVGSREAIPPDREVRGAVAYRLDFPLQTDAAYFGMMLYEGDQIVSIEWQLD